MLSTQELPPSIDPELGMIAIRQSRIGKRNKYIILAVPDPDPAAGDNFAEAVLESVKEKGVKVMHLAGLDVRPKLRGNHIARTLFIHSLELARELGYERFETIAANERTAHCFNVFPEAQLTFAIPEGRVYKPADITLAEAELYLRNQRTEGGQAEGSSDPIGSGNIRITAHL